jgi:hypothetical protein
MLLSRFTAYAGEIIVDFDATDQLLSIYLRKNWNTMTSKI